MATTPATSTLGSITNSLTSLFTGDSAAYGQATYQSISRFGRDESDDKKLLQGADYEALQTLNIRNRAKAYAAQINQSRGISADGVVVEVPRAQRTKTGTDGSGASSSAAATTFNAGSFLAGQRLRLS